MSFFGLSARHWVVPSCALLVVGCSSAASNVEIRTDGRLRVIPQEFTSEVGCSFASGNGRELGHYAATLVDLGRSPDAETEGQPTDDDTSYPREAGSGVAARCTSTTTFSTAASDEGFIEVGHLYAAIVDGYVGEQAPDVSGGRDSDNWSAPAWQWLCGIGGLDETQLDWLVQRASLLKRVELEVDAGAAVTSGVSSTVLSDAGAATWGLSSTALSDAGATAASSDSALTSGSADAQAAVTTGAEPSSPDAATALGDASTTTFGTSTALDAGLSSGADSSSDAAAHSTLDATPNSAVTNASLATESTGTDAATPELDGDATLDATTNIPAQPRDWRAELSKAASGGFAPPPRVVSGGQSGVRGCVPLF